MSDPAGTAAAIRAAQLVLCVRCADAETARAGAFAALAGGLTAIEVTLTTPGALDLIAELAADPRALPGAGTVLTPADADAVADAGGRFAFSPITDPAVIDACHARGLLAVPGAATPGEIVAAHRAGARVVKVFPIGPLGGPAYLRAVRGPLPDIPLLPTNGVTLETLPAYLAAGVHAVGAGSDIMASGDPATIEARARDWARAITT